VGEISIALKELPEGSHELEGETAILVSLSWERCQDGTSEPEAYAER